ncbi:hypothetical protein ARMSODRAFT_112632 [Armillaria solidipes]|uniref:Uncharacterized protein n=1 Tax=Armillaria solidipes TaxID=1076256 RepID=A0A2H3C0T3_9AGAR|nr:hypothetical protein ARMSODRAFT_112632 [Armillaria solidipes]
MKRSKGEADFSYLLGFEAFVVLTKLSFWLRSVAVGLPSQAWRNTYQRSILLIYLKALGGVFLPEWIIPRFSDVDFMEVFEHAVTRKNVPIQRSMVHNNSRAEFAGDEA